MVESTLIYEARELYKQQIAARCKISALYGDLLLSQESPDLRLACASHDWTLRSIQSIADDLAARLPRGKECTNPYSQYITTSSKTTMAIVTELLSVIKYHAEVSTRLEQFGKGVV